MRFQFIEEHGYEFPTNRLCKVLDVSERGLRAYRRSDPNPETECS